MDSLMPPTPRQAWPARLMRQRSADASHQHHQADPPVAGSSSSASFASSSSGATSLFKRLTLSRSGLMGGVRRKWKSTVEAPQLEDLETQHPPPSSSSSRFRRHHDSDGVGDTAAASMTEDESSAAATGAASGSGGSTSRKRSTVRQLLLDSFRPRTRSENRQTLAQSRRQRGRQASGGGDGGDADEDTSQHRLDVGDGDAAATTTGRRPKSPIVIGGLVTRLMNLTTSDRRNSGGGGGGGGGGSASGLPSPSQLPLDSSFITGGVRQRLAQAAQQRSERRADRVRKISCPQSRVSVQEQHKDLFDNYVLAHSGSRSGMSDSPHHHHQQQQQRASRMRHSSSQESGSTSGSIQVRENDKYIIIGPNRDPSTVDLEEIRDTAMPHPGRVFEVFSQRHHCYDLIPTSSKLLVFDHNLNVKKAFFALVYNGLRAAPVWDSASQRFVGMLTISDFISVLHRFYRSALVPMEELESHRISTWRAQLQDRLRPFLWIAPEAPLLDAIRLLLHARVHRLPVVEPRTGNALFILTHKRILKYIYLHMHQLPMPEWLDAPLRSLGIGTYAGIQTVSEATPLVRVLGLFVQHRVSALPVVSADGRLVDIYSKFDVINLAATKTYNNLDVSVKDALQYRRDRFEGVTSCKATDSLRCAIEKLVTAEVHRLVLTDDEKRIVGVVSLSDILKAIVLNHEQLTELGDSDAGKVADGGVVEGGTAAAGKAAPMEVE